MLDDVRLAGERARRHGWEKRIRDMEQDIYTNRR